MENIYYFIDATWEYMANKMIHDAQKSPQVMPKIGTIRLFLSD